MQYIPPLRKEFHYVTTKYQLKHKRIQNEHHKNSLSMVKRNTILNNSTGWNLNKDTKQDIKSQMNSRNINNWCFLGDKQRRKLRENQYFIVISFILENVNLTNHAYKLRQYFTVLNFLPFSIFSFYSCCIGHYHNI